MIEQYNYNPAKDTDRRRKKLKKAIRCTNFDTVFKSLKEKIKEFEGYKKDRAEYDLSWLKKNSKKYYTQF